MYFVYLLECEDKSIYTGITTDVKRRFVEHKEGSGGNYTRTHGAKRVIFIEECSDRSTALKREIEIKSMTHEEKLKIANPKVLT